MLLLGQIITKTCDFYAFPGLKCKRAFFKPFGGMDKMAVQGGDAPKIKRQYPEKEEKDEFGIRTTKRQRYSMNYKSYESATVDPQEQNTRMLEYMFPGYKVRANIEFQDECSQTRLSFKEQLTRPDVRKINADFEVADIIEPVEQKKVVEISEYELRKQRRGSLAPHGWVGPPLCVRMRVSDFLFIEITPVSLPPVLLCLNKGVIDHHTLEINVVPGPQFVPQVVVSISGMEIYPEDKYHIMNVNRVLAKRPEIYMDTNRDIKVRSGGEWKTRDDKGDKNLEYRKIYRFNESEKLKNMKLGPMRKQIEPPASWIDLNNSLKPKEYRLNEYEETEKSFDAEPINVHIENEESTYYRSKSPKQMHKNEPDPFLFSKHFLRDESTQDLVNKRVKDSVDDEVTYLHISMPKTHIELDDDDDNSRIEKDPIKYQSVMDLRKPVVDKEVFQDPRIRGRRGTYFVSKGYSSPGHVMESIDFKGVELSGMRSRSTSRQISELGSEDKINFYQTRTKRGTIMPKNIPKDESPQPRFKTKTMEAKPTSDNSDQMRAFIRQTRTKRGTIMPKAIPESPDESPERPRFNSQSQDESQDSSENMKKFVRETRTKRGTIMPKNIPQSESPEKPTQRSQADTNIAYDPDSTKLSLTSQEKRLLIESRGKRGTFMPKKVPEPSPDIERPRFRSKADTVPNIQYEGESTDFSVSSNDKLMLAQSRGKRGTLLPKNVPEPSPDIERPRFRSKAETVPNIQYEGESSKLSLTSEERRMIIESRGKRGTFMPKKVPEPSPDIERPRFRSKAETVPNIQYEGEFSKLSLTSEEKRMILESRGKRGTFMPKKVPEPSIDIERPRFRSKADTVPNIQYEKESTDFSVSSNDKLMFAQSRGKRGTKIPKNVPEASLDEKPREYESNEFSISSDDKRQFAQSRGKRGTMMPKNVPEPSPDKERPHFRSKTETVPNIQFEAESSNFSVSSDDKRKFAQSRGKRGTMIPKNVPEPSPDKERPHFRSKTDTVPNIQFEAESSNFSVSSDEKRKFAQSRGKRGTMVPKNVPEPSPDKERPRFRSKADTVPNIHYEGSIDNTLSPVDKRNFAQSRSKRGTMMPKNVPEASFDKQPCEYESKEFQSRGKIGTVMPKNVPKPEERFKFKNVPKYDTKNMIKKPTVPKYVPEFSKNIKKGTIPCVPVYDPKIRGYVTVPKKFVKSQRYIFYDKYGRENTEFSWCTNERPIFEERCDTPEYVPECEEVPQYAPEYEEVPQYAPESEEVPQYENVPDCHILEPEDPNFSWCLYENPKIAEIKKQRFLPLPVPEKHEIPQVIEEPKPRFKIKTDIIEPSQDPSQISENMRKFVRETRKKHGTIIPETRFKSEPDTVPNEYKSNDFSIKSEEKRKIMESRSKKGTIIPEKTDSFESPIPDKKHVSVQSDFTYDSNVSSDADTSERKPRARSIVDHPLYRQSRQKEPTYLSMSDIVENDEKLVENVEKKVDDDDKKSKIEVKLKLLSGETDKTKAKAKKSSILKVEDDSKDKLKVADEKDSTLKLEDKDKVIKEEKGNILKVEDDDKDKSKVVGNILKVEDDDKDKSKVVGNILKVEDDDKDKSKVVGNILKVEDDDKDKSKVVGNILKVEDDDKDKSKVVKDEKGSILKFEDNKKDKLKVTNEKKGSILKLENNKKDKKSSILKFENTKKGSMDNEIKPSKNEERKSSLHIFGKKLSKNEEKNSMHKLFRKSSKNDEKKKKKSIEDDKSSQGSLKSILSNSVMRTESKVSMMSRRSSDVLSDRMNSREFLKPPSPFEIYKEEGIKLPESSASKQSVSSFHPLLDEQALKENLDKKELRTVLERSLSKTTYETNDKEQMDRINRYLNARGASPVSPTPIPTTEKKDQKKDPKKKEDKDQQKSFGSGHNFAMYKGDKALEDELSSFLNIFHFSNSKYEDDEKIQKNKKIKCKKLDTIQEEEIDQKPTKSLFDLILNVRNEFNPIRNEIDLLKQKMYRIQKDMPDGSLEDHESMPPQEMNRKNSKLTKKFKLSSNPSL